MQITYHIIPHRDNGLHVKITWEEADNSIWNSLCKLNHDLTKVSHYCRIISDFKFTADSDLIRASRYDLNT